MNNNWNNITQQAKIGRWDHITDEMRAAERARIRKMSDAELVAYFYEATFPIYKQTAEWQIVRVRRLMTRDELLGGN